MLPLAFPLSAAAAARLEDAESRRELRRSFRL
jgi:hypothetical protein